MPVNNCPPLTEQDALFSIAAAYGFTPKVINTWNPYLERSPRVLVPIHVDALVVRQAGATWADTALKTLPAGKTSQRRDLLPKPFAELLTRPAGVYLHWALPDALTAGTAVADTATFPAMPDRWLVTRLSPSTVTPGRYAVRSWVLRAGEQVPLRVDLDGFVEGAPSPDGTVNPLTALGTGDVSWAAYYDNVVNRLAFYDDLRDIQAGPLSYLVCGWYSHREQDPLGDSGIRSLTDFNNKMAELGWQLPDGALEHGIEHSRTHAIAAASLGLPSIQRATSLGDVLSENRGYPAYAVSNSSAPLPAVDPAGGVLGPYTTDSVWWPTATLLHGAVVAIGWPGIGWPGVELGILSGQSGGPPDPSTIRVAVGNTLTEALAALVAENNKAPGEARLLEAFLLGGLHDLNEANGRAEIDALLHANSFSSMDGGYTTEQLWIPQTPATPPSLPNPVDPGPGVFPGQAAASFHTQAFQSGMFQNARVRSGGSAQAAQSVPTQNAAETTFYAGGLPAAISANTNISLNASALGFAPAPIPGHYETVRRALPRLYIPSEPVLLIEGARRSFKHGSDDRFSQDNTLMCRLTGSVVTELSCNPVPGASNRPHVHSQDVLARGIENGSVPPECEDLLCETLLLDPSAAAVLAAAANPPSAPPSVIAATARNFAVEQTVWWATRDPNFDHGPIAALSGFTGTLPTALAITPPTNPWTPLHVDWQVEYIPSTNGLKDWSLGEIDYTPAMNRLPSFTNLKSGITLQGRAHLTGGAAATAAGSLRCAIDQSLAAGGAANLPPNLTPSFNSELAQTTLSSFSAMAANVHVTVANTPDGTIPPVDRRPLEDILTTLSSMDVLTGALDGFTRQMRGGYDPDGKAAPTDGSTPAPFVQLRAGFLRVKRLRLVDCFGQFVDLAGSSDSALVDPSRIIESEPFAVGGNPGILALKPCFNTPSRLWFRYMAGDGGGKDADDTISPVCGYVIPNHLDGDLEFFGADGTNLGDVRPDPQAGIVWDDAPGRPSTVGQSPARAISNPFAAGIAQGLLRWGLADAQDLSHEHALSALLRIIDSTMWTVDPYGSTGDEHLSLLVGHPVVVLRARLLLEVDEPIHPELLQTISLPVRLGALTQWQDGLLGYFVNDDYQRLYCADAAVAGFAREFGPGRGFLQQANLVPGFHSAFSKDLGATAGSSPVSHPYVDTSGVVMVQPNREVALTLLVEPQTVVHSTAGILPSKEIGMRRNWIAGALSTLAPTFRFGPVLVDPQKIRMPVSTDIPGAWSWDHRSDITTWAEDAVVNAGQDARLRPDPASAEEGWLRLKPQPPSGN